MISIKDPAVLVTTPQNIPITDLFNIDKTNPSKYIFLNLYADLDYYSDSPAVGGSLIYKNRLGQDTKISTSHYMGDVISAGTAFMYEPSTGRYKNGSYGYLDQISISPALATNALDVVTLGESNYFDSSYTSMLDMPSVFLNSLAQKFYSSTLYTTNKPQSTSLIDTALSFVGEVWDRYGYWTLVDAIAAINNSSLPMSSMGYSSNAQTNGNWLLKYNGNHPSGDWSKLLMPGDIVIYSDSLEYYGGAAIVVSGSGTNAMVIDTTSSVGNAQYVTIQPPHLFTTDPWYIKAVPDHVFIYSYNEPTKAPTMTTMISKDNNPWIAHGTYSDIYVTPMKDLVFGLGQPVSFQMNEFTVKALVQTPKITYDLPSWLKLGATFNGTAPTTPGVYVLKAFAQSGTLLVEDDVKITIDPKVMVDVGDQHWEAGVQQKLVINKGTNDTFHIKELGNSTHHIFDWLSISNDGVLSGRAPLNMIGQTVNVQISQYNGYSAPHDIDNFAIHIDYPISLVGYLH